jgi:hypothetical protein
MKFLCAQPPSDQDEVHDEEVLDLLGSLSTVDVQDIELDNILAEEFLSPIPTFSLSLPDDTKTENQSQLKIESNSQGKVVLLEIDSLVYCPKCIGPMKEKKGRFGLFMGCCSYPKCDGASVLVK